MTITRMARRHRRGAAASLLVHQAWGQPTRHAGLAAGRARGLALRRLRVASGVLASAPRRDHEVTGRDPGSCRSLLRLVAGDLQPQDA